MMLRVDRDTGRITPYPRACLLFPLLDTVMAGLAEGLPVIGIPEQRAIFPMGNYMIYDGRYGEAAEFLAVLA
jgi:hypothetical protein